jgi:phage terminase large subunit-like protein
MLASYEADFAASWGSRARDVLAEHGKGLYGVSLSHNARSGRRWELERRGGRMISAGVGGPLTGQGAHLLIIDDPVKNAEAAMSEVMRERQWEWWRSTARTRLEPRAVVLILMTRWHEGDLGGRLLAEEGDPVREIRLPALAEDADPLGREKGAALWPERYTPSYLEKTRNVVGPYWFSAMYQGRPTPDKGGIFDRRDFRYFEMRDGIARVRRDDGTIGEFDSASCRKAIYVDLAVSEKQTADYTVAMEVWVTPEGQILIMDLTRRRIPGPQQADFLQAIHEGMILKIEAIGYQTALVQELRRRGVPVEPVHPDKDKVTRASAAGAQYRAQKVLVEHITQVMHEPRSRGSQP